MNLEDMRESEDLWIASFLRWTTIFSGKHVWWVPRDSLLELEFEMMSIKEGWGIISA